MIHENQISKLLSIKSKHSQYQELYGDLSEKLGVLPPSGKCDSKRWHYMISNLDIRAKTVLDIGANTGFFSFAAVDAGAKFVNAVEGNLDHADFILKAAKLLKIESHLRVENRIFAFNEINNINYEVIFCLNVLHHLGEDFGGNIISLDLARQGIIDRIQMLSHIAKYCWLQIGYNWTGNRNLPLFTKGAKKQMIDFVSVACNDHWVIKKIAVFSPYTLHYEDAKVELLERFDSSGEFLNRPLFLLETLQMSSH